MSKQIIIDVYLKIITEYIAIMEQSAIVNTSPDKRHIIYGGLNAINHIFKINLVSSKNIQTTYFYCEKAGYCYLEYIEQINKTDILTNLNIIDVITFVYKETIIHNNEHPIPKNTDTYTDINILVSEDLDQMLCNLTTITNLLLQWNISPLDQTIICNKYLPKYLKFFLNNPRDTFIEYLGIILEKTKMNESTYFEFLEEFYKRIISMNKKNKLPDEMTTRFKIIKLLNYTDAAADATPVLPIKAFVKTLLL